MSVRPAGVLAATSRSTAYVSTTANRKATYSVGRPVVAGCSHRGLIQRRCSFRISLMRCCSSREIMGAVVTVMHSIGVPIGKSNQGLVLCVWRLVTKCHPCGYVGSCKPLYLNLVISAPAACAAFTKLLNAVWRPTTH